MTILITLNMGDITYNDITNNWFSLKMTLLITVNSKHKCNATFISVSKDIIRKVFISIMTLIRMGLSRIQNDIQQNDTE